MSELDDLKAAAERVTLDHVFAVETRDDGAISVSVQFRCERDAVDVPSVAGFDAAFKTWWNTLTALSNTPPKEDAPWCGLCGNHDWNLSQVTLTRKGLFQGENLFHVELMICLKCANEIEREFLSKALKTRICEMQEAERAAQAACGKGAR